MRTIKIPAILTAILSLGCTSEDDFADDSDEMAPNEYPPASDSDDPANVELEETLGGAFLYTLESNNDKKLTPGERTMPELDLDPKGTCSGNIEIYWSSCLTEVKDDVEWVDMDLNERRQCGDFRTILECSDSGVLSQGDTVCMPNERNAYCEISITETDESMRCGWRLVGLLAKDVRSGRTLEDFSFDYIQKLGFELLPIVL